MKSPCGDYNLQSWAKYWTGQEKFDIYFCVVFLTATAKV